MTPPRELGAVDVVLRGGAKRESLAHPQPTAQAQPRPADPPPASRRCPTLNAVTPTQLLRGITATPGLVVLSGAWAGGGLILGQQPRRTISRPADLPDVFGNRTRRRRDTDTSAPQPDGPHTPTAANDADADANSDRSIGGGWFGFMGYPQTPIDASACWFGHYPNVLRYSTTSNAWYDEALPPSGDDPVLDLPDRRQHLIQRATKAATQPRPTPGYRLGIFTPNVTAGGYAAAVEQCINHIRAGDIYQANICLRLTSDFDGDPAALFADLVEALHPDYAALICGPTSTVVSLSPELYLRRTDRHVHSAPIKGTLPRSTCSGPDPQADRLRRSIKDRAENVMIVDLVRNDLARVARTGTVSVPGLMQVEPHCGVWHLVSHVAAELPEQLSDHALIQATFPPGSVTGAPKLAAQRIIDDLETAPRGVYTGAVGYCSPLAGLELNVAIRTLELRSSNPLGHADTDATSTSARPGHRAQSAIATLGVGAGITAGSDPAAEWRECLDKAAPLLRAGGTRLHADVAVRAGHAGRERAGIFETMLVLDGMLVDLEPHLDRLTRSLQQLWDTEPPPELAEALRRRAASMDMPAGRLRLRLIRHSGRRVHYELDTAHVPRPAHVIGQPGLRLHTATTDQGIGCHKWTDRRLVEHLETGRREQVLVTDRDGQILEGSRGNVLAFRGRSLTTPPLDGRILPGTTRRTVLDLAAESDIEVNIGPLMVSELSSCDALAVTSSLSGLRWVRWCPGGGWRRPTTTLAQLSTALLSRWATPPTSHPHTMGQ